MPIQVIDTSFDKKIFNAVANHPLQSWEWGEARKRMGIEVLRIGEFKENTLQNVFQITFHKLPYLPYSVGYLPRSKSPSKRVLEYLIDYGKKNKVLFIKLEPYEQMSSISNLTSHFDSKFQISKSSHPLFPEWTQMLDLTKSEEELLKAMHPKTRYNIRLAQKKSVIVQEMSNEKGFEIFSKLYFDTCRRQQYYGHTQRYHKIVWESLENSIAHILIASFNKTPVAAYELFYFKDIFYYPYGGTSLEFRNVMAPNLLMWEAIRLGKKLGAKKFDMWGSLPQQYDKNHSWAGFTRFKEGYGGKFEKFAGSYDLIIDPTGYSFYNSLYMIRSTYLKIRKKFS